MNTKLLT